MADEPSDGSDKHRDAPTVRDLKGPELSSDTLPDVVGLYVPPRPLPEVSHHRTLDLQSVRLSAQADPRRALTERRLVSPPTAAPERRRRGAWFAAGALLLLAIGAWAFFWNSESPPQATPAHPASVTKTLVTATGASRAVRPPATASEPAVGSSAKVGEDQSPKLEDAGVSAPASKARSRDSAKKRKDPWLE